MDIVSKDSKGQVSNREKIAVQWYKKKNLQKAVSGFRAGIFSTVLPACWIHILIESQHKKKTFRVCLAGKFMNAGTLCLGQWNTETGRSIKLAKL